MNSDNVDMQQNENNEYLEEMKVPSFLKNDEEEAKSYRKVEALGRILQDQLDKERSPGEPKEQITQALTRTYVVSEMFVSEEQSGVLAKPPVTCGNIVAEGLAPRLNVIFDVDHTLIYAFDRNLANVIPGTSRDTHLIDLHDARGT